MMFILGAIVGGSIGFVMAAIMSNAHELDEQERRKVAEQPPVIKEEKKLIPLVAVQEIPFEHISSCPNDIVQKAITNSLMGQLNDEIRQKVKWDIDPYRRKHIVKLRIWVDKE